MSRQTCAYCLGRRVLTFRLRGCTRRRHRKARRSSWAVVALAAIAFIYYATVVAAHVVGLAAIGGAQ